MYMSVFRIGETRTRMLGKRCCYGERLALRRSGMVARSANATFCDLACGHVEKNLGKNISIMLYVLSYHRLRTFAVSHIII